IERLFDTASPLHFAMTGTHGLIGIKPDMHAITTRFLGRIARGIGGLQDQGGITPMIVNGYQSNACANSKAPFVMGET
ncbi:hypothetical protein ABTM75_20305, partial [Acinetobacter baumannii]